MFNWLFPSPGLHFSYFTPGLCWTATENSTYLTLWTHGSFPLCLFEVSRLLLQPENMHLRCTENSELCKGVYFCDSNCLSLWRYLKITGLGSSRPPWSWAQEQAGIQIVRNYYFCTAQVLFAFAGFQHDVSQPRLVKPFCKCPAFVPVNTSIGIGLRISDFAWFFRKLSAHH